jgi:hypothetical protein
MRLFKRIVISSLFFTLTVFCRGQVSNKPLKDSLIGNIIEQIVLFPQEKLYLHTDKPLYISGEKIWFRAWLVDAVLHTPVINQYVYVELISPLDSFVTRVKIRPDHGAYSGFIDLDQRLPEGNYTLRAYTENMLNMGEDYFFRNRIRVAGPFSATVNTAVEYRYDDKDKITAEVSFTDIKTGKKIIPDKLKMSINSQPLREVSIADDTVAYFPFRLPDDSNHRVLYIETGKSGEYMLIPYLQDDFDVSFYPEGGYLLDGVNSIVAFKALNPAGLPEKITGRIIDSAGNEYAKIETVHDGMGSFNLASEEGMVYYAVCRNDRGIEKRFELPSARQGMYALAAEIVNDTLYLAVLKSSDIREEKDLFLVLHTRGMLHYSEPWDYNYDAISFNRALFPSGVLQIILFDGNMNPLSERLVFCNNNDQAQIVFNADRPNYEARQPVNTVVKLTGRDGLPREGTFSVSVTDDSDIQPDSTVTIMTTLLLSSDLRGYINDPAFYFQENNPLAANALDLLMLTNGWRRYNIPDVLTGKYRHPGIPAKSGMEITGKVISMVLRKPVVKGSVAAFSWEAGYFEEAETDTAGCFAFKGIEFEDSTKFILQALNKKGSGGVELLIDSEKLPRALYSSFLFSPKTGNIKDGEQLSNYITKADTKYTFENGMRTIYIDEVIIKATAPKKKDYSFSYYMPKVAEPSMNIIDYEQIEEYHPINLSEIINHIPFVSVEGGKVVINRMSLSMNGTLYAVLIVDDMIIHDYDIDSYDPYSIERIAVLKGTQAAILGGDGAGGAVVITTRKGYIPKDNTPNYNIKTVTPLGYQRPAEFYSPRYETEEQRESGPRDLRTTIYWNPNVIISPTGEAWFDFYCADASTSYTVMIEGVTSDGMIIQSRNSISRK